MRQKPARISTTFSPLVKKTLPGMLAYNEPVADNKNLRVGELENSSLRVRTGGLEPLIRVLQTFTNWLASAPHD